MADVPDRRIGFGAGRAGAMFGLHPLAVIRKKVQISTRSPVWLDRRERAVLAGLTIPVSGPLPRRPVRICDRVSATAFGKQEPARYQARDQTGCHELRRIVLSEADDFSAQIPRRRLTKALRQIVNHIHGLPDHAGRLAVARARRRPHLAGNVVKPVTQIASPAVKLVKHQRRDCAASALRLVPDPTGRSRQAVPRLFDLAARGIRQSTPFDSH
jgi:hypothetical protein